MKKNLPVIWQPKAEAEFEEIITGLAYNSPKAADHMYELILDSVRFIGKWPMLFPVSQKIRGTREIVAHRNYLVFYRVTRNAVQVVSVQHARRSFE